jgi:hypothetical protein
MKNQRLFWMAQAVAGLLLTGSGLSVTIEAGLNKVQGNEWFWLGTFGLVLFQAGLCLVIDASKKASD